MDPRSEAPADSSQASGLAVQLSARFSAALESGESPEIETYLAQVPKGERPRLLAELLSVEVSYHRRRGRPCTAEDYRGRFPGHDELVTTICAAKPLPPGEAPQQTGQTCAGEPKTARTPLMVPMSDVMSDVVLASGSGDTGAPAPDGPDSLLAGTWPFCELPRPVTDAVRARMTLKEFAAGEVLIRQGEPSRCLMAVVEGRVEVRVRQQQGQWHDVAEAGGAMILGEMGLVTDEPCTATVVAKTPVRAMVLPAEQFRRLAARHNVLWVALSQLIAERLGRVEMDVLTGKVLEGYRIKRAVGRGGMAVVYEAEAPVDGRRVALKMMSHRFTHDLEAQQRFEREMEICRSLDHPNISRIFGCFTSFGTNFMVLEYCDGVSLAKLIHDTGALGQEEVRKIAGQLAAALDYAHRRDVCHRDLKPSNMMIGRDGMLKLMDFGLAKTSVSPDLTHVGNVLGTPRYMAPEQLAGKRADGRADVFAFGSIVYEMLTGRPLFRGKDILAIIMRQMVWSLPARVKIRPDLEEDLYAVLRESLDKKPERRVLELARLVRWSAPVSPELLS